VRRSSRAKRSNVVTRYRGSLALTSVGPRFWDPPNWSAEPGYSVRGRLLPLPPTGNRRQKPLSYAAYDSPHNDYSPTIENMPGDSGGEPGAIPRVADQRYESGSPACHRE